MASFNRDNQSGGNRNFGKPRFNNNRSERPELFKTTCASCGNTCEVPFRPTGSKPVYCRDCFKNQPADASRRSDSRSFDRPQQGDRQMFDAVCSNCGNACQIPFRPSQGRDVFCSRCFDMNNGETHRPSRSNDRPSFKRDENQGRSNDAPNYKAQFEALNAKMDKILELLTPAQVATEPLESILEEEVIEEAVAEALAKPEEKKPKKKTASKTPAKEKPDTKKKSTSKKK